MLRFVRWYRTPMTVCAWCPPATRTVIRYGNPFMPTSHGMCPTCSAAWTREAAAHCAIRAALQGSR